MRKTLLFTLCCFALTALSAQKTCKTFEDNFYFTGVDAKNMEEMLECAGIFYDRQFGSRTDLISTRQARLLMRQVVTDLLHNGTDPACDPGDPRFTGRGPCATGLNGNGGEMVSVNFRWPKGNTGAFGKFIDFSDGEIGEDERSDPGLSYEVKNCVDAKFFAMHSTCNNSAGSSFYIIIVDKDLEFEHFPHGLPVSTESAKRKVFTAPEIAPQVSIYPNPLSTDIIQMNLEFTETTNISVQLYSSTYQFIQKLSVANIMEAGSHHLNFDLNNLTKGVYYMVVNINGKRQVEKIVKM